MANYRLSTNDGRFLTLLTNDGPVTAEANNPGALNQIWSIPNFANHNSTVQNLGFAPPMPFAISAPAGVAGGQAPLAWNFVAAGGNNLWVIALSSANHPRGRYQPHVENWGREWGRSDTCSSKLRRPRSAIGGHAGVNSDGTRGRVA
ncbi:hypothetical protein BU15DRAFT_64375 [Melanogaster broomeanus]|nr:hypothetical protein BU15DRAFT_64375 [Melanogaster broomeanus]